MTYSGDPKEPKRSLPCLAVLLNSLIGVFLTFCWAVNQHIAKVIDVSFASMTIMSFAPMTPSRNSALASFPILPLWRARALVVLAHRRV